MPSRRPAQELVDPRRAPRFPARCAVDVRHRLSRWRAETDDLGPDGFQLVTPRPIPPGRTLRLALHLPQLDRRVEGSGTVVWSRAAAPTRLGVRFTPDRGHAGWFERLQALEPALAGAPSRAARLPPEARLYLGTPPRWVLDFTRDELAVLRRVRRGIGVAEVATSFGAAPERLTGALFALLSRGCLVTSPARSPGPNAWREVLVRAAAMEAADGNGPERVARAPVVQQLLDEGRVHLAAGRVALAAARFREALALAPEDAEAREELQAVAMF